MFFLHLVPQWTVRRRNNPDINTDLVLTSHRDKLPVIENRKEFYLQGQRHVTNLGQKERAFIGHFEHSRFVSRGTGKRPFYMPEEFRLEKADRQSATIDLDERKSRPGMIFDE